MITVVTANSFIDSFQAIRPDNFSYKCDTPMELDVIALCCEFSEHATAVEALASWQVLEDLEASVNKEASLSEIKEELEKLALEYLQENTMVITFDGGIIIQDF